MTPQKLTGFNRFVCFVIVAIIVILIIGFVASGRQNNEPPGSGDVGNSTNDTDGNNDNNGTNNKNDTLNNEYSDDNTNSEDSNQDASEEKPTVYTNPITGLVVSETQYNSIPLATVVNPVSPLYGVSNADIAIEFPLEDGSSRMLVYNTSEAPLWKIGALVPTRSFISSMSAFFGGMVVSYGDDGKFISSVQESSYLIDISNNCSNWVLSFSP